MDVKKALALIGASLVAIALAAPASASAEGMFYDEGEEITSPISGEFNGTFGFAMGLGAYQCTSHIPVSIGTTEGEIENFEITSETCEGSGILGGCELEHPTVTFTLTHLTVTFPPLRIRASGSLTIHFTLDINCPVTELEVIFEDLSTTPDNSSEISSASLSGEGTTVIGGLEVATEAYGSLNVTPAGTIGIE